MKLFLILLSVCLSFAVTAQAQFTHHLIQEPTDSGLIRYTVIEEDLSLRDQPDQISQYVIYKKISVANDPNIMTEALKHSVALNSLTNSFLKDFDQPLSPPPPPPPAAKPLWTAIKNTWSAQDEKDYQTWFEINVNTDFNKGTALLADCADVALLFRWAYAHDKQLPVANTLSGSGKLFGHFSSSAAWDKLPSDPDWRKDERFKQAMRYLFDNAYTHSIFSDLYPTQINSTYVHPGSIYMIIRKSSGHAQTIHQFAPNIAGIKTLWGNEPSAEIIYSSLFIWEPAVKNIFGSWRWPIYQDGAWKLTSAKNMPGYSDEQFAKRKDLGEDLFQAWTLDALGLADYDEIKLTREIQAVKEALEYRVGATAQGSLICGFKACDVAGADYENYSTNSRDARLFQFQASLLKSIASYGGVTAAVVQAALAKTYNIDEVVLAGFPYTYKDFILNETLLKNIKADANLTFNQRWGLETFADKVSQFKFYQMQLLINVYNRKETVDTAYSFCLLKACDPKASSVVDMNTVKMDRGFAALADLLGSLQKDHMVDQGTLLEETYQNYRDILVSDWGSNKVSNPLCENPTQCTMYDVLWKDNGMSRVKTWKSQPTDSTGSRWGL